MKRVGLRIGTASIAMLLAGFVLGGCDLKPENPGTAAHPFSPVESLHVDTNDPMIVAAVTKVETARAEYKYNLEVLQGYYQKMGNVDRGTWARKEGENLLEAKTFEWDNPPQIQPPGGANLNELDEREQVERVVAARRAYIQSVDELIRVYADKRDGFKQQVIEVMRDRLDPIRLYPYFPDSLLPPRNLRGTQVDPEADKLYAEARALFKRGKGVLHWAASTSYEDERRACQLFLKLVYEYPRSNKIAMSAYYIAEINKEYFKENTLAVYWYERAWLWDPHLPEPAYFQAATVYDVHLHNYQKAVWCFKQSMIKDPPRPGNYGYAQRRIRELTGE